MLHNPSDPEQQFHSNTLLSYLKHSDTLLNLRNRHLFLLDLLVLSILPTLALFLRQGNLHSMANDGQVLALFTLVGLLVKLPIFYGFGLYRRYWRYASIDDLARLLLALGLSTTLLTLFFGTLQEWLRRFGLFVPGTLASIDGLLAALIVGGSRAGLRGLHHWHRQVSNHIGTQRVLVVGAGEAGTMVVREIRANPKLNMQVVAFVDDDPAKINSYIESVLVVGRTTDMPTVVSHYQIQQIITAIPAAPLARQQEIAAICNSCGVPTHNFTGVYALLAGHKTISRLPQVDVNRLLGREPIKSDQSESGAMLHGASVLITGAGGSIGSELCRQIAQFEPAQLILLGHGENSIFEIGLDLRLAFPNLVTHSLIVDVRDQQRVNWAVETYCPHFIFHAAAHKHVPFMEENISEAVTNNVLGTQNVLCAAERYGVEHFVLISTDKAVNPTSIMGATKRLAELLVQSAARRTGHRYTAVRFGNVLGSRGSVIPVFQRQIAAGGPLTITHPDMQRYFMTIPEAVQLVLQAAVLSQGGEVFLLDMGHPVRIMDLATALINLSGLQPERDIKIVQAGIRPGEKLYEELFLASEAYRRTKHEKIFVATRGHTFDDKRLEKAIAKLVILAQAMQTQAVIDCIQEIIPEYQPKPRPTTPASSQEPTLRDVLYPKPTPVGV